VNPAYVEITVLDLVLASLLLLVNLGLSAALKLGLTRRLGIAAIRMVVQLALVGLVLEWVFTSENGLLVLGIGLVMGVIAGVTAARRTKIRFTAAYWDSVVVIVASSFVITGFALVGVLDVDPWWDPQYFIPLLGMLLGNSLTGISLGLDRFLSGVLENRKRLEGLLALGATRWEAARGEISEALRVGLIPTVNSMLVMGVVSLPGMMTGQILAGADPADAVRYQVLIMFMIAASVASATFGVTILAYFRVFTSDHRVRGKDDL